MELQAAFFKTESMPIKIESLNEFAAIYQIMKRLFCLSLLGITKMM